MTSLNNVPVAYLHLYLLQILAVI